MLQQGSKMAKCPLCRWSVLIGSQRPERPKSCSNYVRQKVPTLNNLAKHMKANKESRRQDDESTREPPILSWDTYCSRTDEASSEKKIPLLVAAEKMKCGKMKQSNRLTTAGPSEKAGYCCEITGIKQSWKTFLRQNKWSTSRKVNSVICGSKNEVWQKETKQ